MSEYLALKGQIAELEKKAELLRLAERGEAIATARALIETFSIHAIELGYSARGANKRPEDKTRRTHSTAGIKLPAKYSDASGNVWTGRGVKPLWLRDAIEKGAMLESFVVTENPDS